MTKEFEGSGRGKKRNQKMKPFLVYQYLMRHTDEKLIFTALKQNEEAFTETLTK